MPKQGLRQNGGPFIARSPTNASLDGSSTETEPGECPGVGTTLAGHAVGLEIQTVVVEYEVRLHRRDTEERHHECA